MSQSDVLATIAILISVIAVPTSAIISYRYAIKGEKRKEWNALSEPVMSKLEEVKDLWSKEINGHINFIPLDNIEGLRRRMTHSEKIKFDSLWGKLDTTAQKIRKSPAPMIGSKEEWESPYPEGVDIALRLLLLLKLR